MPSTAKLIELFSAIQGEGIDIGTRQIFIRFARCDLRCHFCDSAHTWHIPDTCRIEQTPGMRDFQTQNNPATLDRLLEWVRWQNIPGLHDSISLTGGEPLLQAPFLIEFLPQVRHVTGLPIYLETGGHRPKQLDSILPYLDSVGMDVKLPSVSGETWWSQHRECLQLCDRAGVKVFVKMIVGDRANPDELLEAAQLVGDVNPEIPLILQPVTPLAPEAISKHRQLQTLAPPSPARVLEWQASMKRHVKHVRAIPQTHKMLNQL